VKNLAGNQLALVQFGGLPDDWKPMSSIGKGVMEIRISKQGQYRILYVAKFPDAIYILHAFQKKSQKTASHDINIARRAYAEIEERN